MKVKIIKGIYFILSLALFLVWVVSLGVDDVSLYYSMCCILLIVLFNPYFVNVILELFKVNKKIYEEAYIGALKLALTAIGIIIAFIVAYFMFLIRYWVKLSTTLDDFTTVLQLSNFLTYILIIHLCKSENKHINYKAFGVYYLICVILMFASDSFSEEIIQIFNIIPNTNMDKEVYASEDSILRDKNIKYLVVTENKNEKLVPIEGTPVDMLNPPAGCPFAPRCDAAMKICLREMPPQTELEGCHYTKCWMIQKEQFEAKKGEA